MWNRPCCWDPAVGTSHHLSSATFPWICTGTATHNNAQHDDDDGERSNHTNYILSHSLALQKLEDEDLGKPEKMAEEQQESKFYQIVAMAIVIGLSTILFVLFGLEKTGTYDGVDSINTGDVATKNSETLEVRGPFTK